MKSILKIELKRAFCNKLFYCVLLAGCIMAAGVFFTSNAMDIAKLWDYEYLNGTDYGVMATSKINLMDVSLYIWMGTKAANNVFSYLFAVIVPVLAAIPYGATYLTDVKSGLVNQITARVKKSSYYLAKLITAFVSGGTVAVVPVFFNLLMCMCVLPWGTPIYSTHYFPVGTENVFADLFYTHPVIYLIIYFAFSFIVAGLFNCLCMTFVYFVDNIFVILLVPFIMYFSLHVIFTYCTNMGHSSLLWASKLTYFYKDGVVAIVMQLIILTAAALSFLIRSKKDVI